MKVQEWAASPMLLAAAGSNATACDGHEAFLPSYQPYMQDVSTVEFAAGAAARVSRAKHTSCTRMW